MPSKKLNNVLPVLPLRDVVVYPNMIADLFVGRKRTIEAIVASNALTHRDILLVSQLDPRLQDPRDGDIHSVGTLAKIIQIIKLSNNSLKLIVEGQNRAVIGTVIDEGNYMSATWHELHSEHPTNEDDTQLIFVLRKQVVELMKSSGENIPEEITKQLNNETNLEYIIDLIAASFPFNYEFKQSLLETTSIVNRVEAIIHELELQNIKNEVDKTIKHRVKKQIDSNQRDYYLNEQMKAIKEELNEGPDELDKLNEQIKAAKMPDSALEKSKFELQKLKMLSPMSSEASVVRCYLDWLVKLPWSKRSRLNVNLERAKKKLDEQHYGLVDVKERIIEFLAVQRRVKHQKGPIMCLVGPPGVGKTSLGESIAQATGRKFVRMSLGGVRDEAEIRGHRRTYIGSLPGKIVQLLSRAGTNNPLFLLDEIDKLGVDYRGDPAAALLEVLDPEQNKTFNDHYLELDFDLSKVMFICTANSMDIPEPLLDRLEVIRIPGYTEVEKLKIATDYLIPKSIKSHGLLKGEMELKKPALVDIVRHYTRESGVRNLNRQIDKLIRKVVTSNVVKEHCKKSSKKPTKQLKSIINIGNLPTYLGVHKFRYELVKKQNSYGQATGLAWTNAGGELMTIEVESLHGKGNVIKTGSLGEVMQESIQAAFTVVRDRADGLGIDSDFYKNVDLHIHVPEGAIPKDGPSSGIGMCAAMISELTSIPVKWDVAMTGEITLKGQVLAIGGLKEKLLAAHLRGIKTVIIPRDNVKDLSEIDEQVKNDLHIVPVENIEEVMEVALESMPVSRLTDVEGLAISKNKTKEAYQETPYSSPSH